MPENKNRFYSQMYSYANIGVNPLVALAGTPAQIKQEVLKKAERIVAAQEEIDKTLPHVEAKYDAYVQ